MNTIKINRALADLASEGVPKDIMFPIVEWLARANAEALRDREVPNEDDTRWPLLEPLTIDEHIALRSREKSLIPLSCAITEGRAYDLTEAQRAVLREWYNMIPTPTVEVVSLSVFDGSTSALRLAKEVILKTTTHRPRGMIENAPRKIVIKHWGRFMSACAAREVEMREERELAALRGRVHDIFKRAKNHKPQVIPVSSAGGLAQQWHALIVERGISKIVDPMERASAKRDLLREVLASNNEHALLALVKDPTFFPATRDEEEYGELMKMLKIS